MYVLQPISSEIPEFVNSSGNLIISIYIALTRYTNITNSKNTAKHHFKLPEKLLLFIIYLLLARLESAYSLIWGSHEIGERVVGTPWHFYDK